MKFKNIGGEIGMIKVEAYNPKWKSEFDIAKKFYRKLLEGIEHEVVHVGSTSVEGLWAKPILDIDIIVNNDADSKAAIRLLQSTGYTHIGNNGVEGRESFEYEKTNLKINWMTHHLYVCITGNENLNNHLF